jgi:hypothetical protein
VTDAAGRGEPASAARTAGWIVAGAGAIGLALAGVSGIVLLDEKSTVTAHCPQTRACDAAGAAAASANKTWLPLNTVAWIAGVIGAGVGAYLVLTAPSGRSGLGVAPQSSGAAVTTWVTF